jgi:hypothetical protein
VETADELARVFHTQVAADVSRRYLRCGKNAPTAGCVAQTDRREGQPGGLVDGSRWSFGVKGERPPGSRVEWPSTPEGCQTQPGRHCLARSSRLRSDESGTPAGVQDIWHVVTRRSPPPNPRRPPATLCQPFGLSDPECPNPTARRTARPTFKRADDLGNTPVSRRYLRCGKNAPTAVGGYA